MPLACAPVASQFLIIILLLHLALLRCGSEFYVENVLEELDVEREWFFNKTTRMLFYYPPKSDTLGPNPGDSSGSIAGAGARPAAPPATRGTAPFARPAAAPGEGSAPAEFEVTHLKQLLTIVGTQEAPVVDVVIEVC